jgi:hypothetical protein
MILSGEIDGVTVVRICELHLTYLVESYEIRIQIHIFLARYLHACKTEEHERKSEISV